MTHLLYKLKETFLDLYRYPQRELKNEHVDYDTYWGDKRGKDLGKLSHWQKLRADLALAHMVQGAPLSLLDIGCGDGSVLAYMKKNRDVARAIGVDVSEKALARARELGIETLRSQTDPLKSLPVSLKADYVCLFEVLEHMFNPEILLGAMVETAERGVFFSFPNTGYVTHRLRLAIFGRFPLQWRVHPSEHLRFWTLADLKWWLTALGYRNYVIEVYEGVPVLNRLWPSLFAKGLFVYLPKG
jgi:methionine biosynthesis protein MetW